MCKNSWKFNVKNSVSKLAMDHPKQWHTYLPMVMCCLREVPNETTGVAPWTLVMGHLPRGPLAILKDSWCDQDLPISFGKNAQEYLKELHDKLEVAKTYATTHSQREQEKYATHYNLRSKDKHFEVGEKVLIIMPDSTASRAFSKWTGPATVVEVLPPYSYAVDVAGTKRRFHANKLRKFHVRVESVAYDSWCFVNTCAVVYENDNDFGDINVIPLSTKVSSPVRPSEMIDRTSINHLGREQQTELLAVLDRYPECFSDVPGLTDVIKHSIPLVPGFKPKRLHAYRVPERLKPEVDRQIQEMLDNGIIRPSHSPMASPLVCVLKGEEGCDGVRLAVNYRYVNRFTRDA